MTLAALRVPTAGFLKLRWSPRREPFQHAAEILGNPTHPEFARAQSEHNNTPEDGFRWKVITNMSKKQLREEVLRRRLKRRWQAAFREAFKAKGLDYNGKKLKSGDLVREQRELRGSLEIHIYGGQGFDDPFHYLVKQAESTLTAIAKKMNAGTLN